MGEPLPSGATQVTRRLLVDSAVTVGATGMSGVGGGGSVGVLSGGLFGSPGGLSDSVRPRAESDQSLDPSALVARTSTQ